MKYTVKAVCARYIYSVNVLSVGGITTARRMETKQWSISHGTFFKKVIRDNLPCIGCNDL